MSNISSFSFCGIASDTHCSKPPFFVHKFNFRKNLNLRICFLELNLTKDIELENGKKFMKFQVLIKNLVLVL